MSPDDHYQDLKRVIAAVGGKAFSQPHGALRVARGGSKTGKQMPADFQVTQGSVGEQDLLLKWLHPALLQNRVSHETL